MELPLHERVTRWNALFFDDLEALAASGFRRRPGADRHAASHRRRARPDGRADRRSSQLLHANFTSYLADDLLVKTDRCTMANSLEARSPFLDRELIEYAAALPDDLKLHGRRTKVILRDAFPDLLPPAIERRGKMGFGVPLDAWFRGELRDYLRDLLLAPDARYRDMLSRAVRRSARRRAIWPATPTCGQQLWSIMLLRGVAAAAAGVDETLMLDFLKENLRPSQHRLHRWRC